jgi:carboxyl-terminal processing protease
MNGESQEKLTLFSWRLPRRRFLWALSLALAVCAGMLYDRWVSMTGVPPGAQRDFQLIAQAWNLIHRNYVDRSALQSSVLTHAAIQGMTDSLGDSGHTVFLNPEMRRHAGAAMRSNFTGIGVEIKTQDRRAVVVATLDGSPALLAGVRAGDIILEVDGKSVAGLSLGELEDLITGPAGAPVRLGVLDPGDSRRKEFTIVRASIKIPNVTWHALPGGQVAHLRVALFSEGVARDVRAALLEIQRQGMNRVILDLRNDPGGVLDEAVGVASEFLSGGSVFLSKNADGKITPQPVKPGGVATNMPVVVLINGGSASASEIVAGALRDAHRAVLVGQTTFGTGTVLDQFQLADGSALLLAVGEWLTPSGCSFWHHGIKPDAEVALPGNTLALLPAHETDLTAASLQACGDQQLLRALSLLTNPPEK